MLGGGCWAGEICMKSRPIFVTFTCNICKSVLMEEFTKTFQNLKSVFDGTSQNILLGTGKKPGEGSAFTAVGFPEIPRFLVVFGH